MVILGVVCCRLGERFAAGALVCSGAQVSGCADL